MNTLFYIASQSMTWPDAAALIAVCFSVAFIFWVIGR